MTVSILRTPHEALENAPHDDLHALVDRCLAGHDAAYTQLYSACNAMVYRLCYSLLGNVEDAEEVLQDSFEYAFRKLATFDANKASFKTWLYRIAVSRCRNKRRRKWLPTFSLSQILAEDSDITDERTPTPAEVLHLTEEQQRVWDALEQLTPKLREVAVLRYYGGMRYPEIGAVLEIGHKTAESRMRLAHKQLKVLLKE